MRELISPLIEISVGDLLVFKCHCDGFGRARRLLFEQMVNAFVFGIIGYGFIPFD